jgi:hypothetical protein
MGVCHSSMAFILLGSMCTPLPALMMNLRYFMLLTLNLYLLISNYNLVACSHPST